MMRNVLHVVPLYLVPIALRHVYQSVLYMTAKKMFVLLDDHLRITHETLDNRKDCTMNYKTHLSAFCGEKTENCMK